MKKLVTTLSVLALVCSSLAAQDNREHKPERPEPPKMKEPTELAKEKADQMSSEVGLDAKQYKKVYNLFKKDFEYRQSTMRPPEGFPEGGFQGGGPGGMPGGGMGGPGGGMGGPGGGMPGGGMGGPGGMPGGGMGGPDGGMGPGGHGGMPPRNNAITEEYLENQDAKLKKLLTEEQYAKWRSKHPAEYLELPGLEAKPF